MVVNSSVIGVHKPAQEYFQAACVALDTPPARVLFVDDEDWAVRGARAAGLSAHRWGGHADLRYLRAALRLLSVAVSSPVTPSMRSRIRSAWPLCRAYSSIMCTYTQRRLKVRCRRRRVA